MVHVGNDMIFENGRIVYIPDMPDRTEERVETGPVIVPTPQEIEDNCEALKWYKTPTNVGSNTISFVDPEDYGITKTIFAPSQYFSQSEEHMPTRKQFIYSSLPQDIYVMYPNNIILPVAQHQELASRFYGRFDGNADIKSAQGVYVLDYISVKELRSSKVQFQWLVDFYRNTNIVATENKQIIDTIINNVMYGRDHSKYLRIITFIPEYNFRNHNAVFVPNTGLCLGSGEIMRNYVHPNSREGQHLKKGSIGKEARNFVVIDIVDNSTNNDYFFKVGKKIYKLEPDRDKEKEEGIGYTVYKNNTKAESTFVSLDRASEELGVYNSRIECEYDGNMERQISNEERKLRLEDKRLDLEETKMLNETYRTETNRDIAVYQRETAKLEFGKEIMKHAYWKEKFLAELEVIGIEREERKQKYLLEAMKRKFARKELKLDMIKLGMEADNLEAKREIHTIDSCLEWGKLGMKLINLIS